MMNKEIATILTKANKYLSLGDMKKLTKAYLTCETQYRYVATNRRKKFKEYEWDGAYIVRVGYEYVFVENNVCYINKYIGDMEVLAWWKLKI